MKTIDRKAPVIVDAGEPNRTTWGQFLDDNADGIDTTEAARLERDLLKRPGCTAFGGGGAEGRYTIRLDAGYEPLALTVKHSGACGDTRKMTLGEHLVPCHASIEEGEFFITLTDETGRQWMLRRGDTLAIS